MPEEPARFTHRVPTVGGGLVISTVEQRADWSHDYSHGA